MIVGHHDEIDNRCYDLETFIPTHISGAAPEIAAEVICRKKSLNDVNQFLSLGI